jgi:mono/diheme cytochrome c family protein
MKNLLHISFFFLSLVTIPAFSQTANSNQAHPEKKQVKSNALPASGQKDGQQVFEQNCSRCHTAPQGFPPRISGTVARHMRVRAGLSREDELALLRFLNP